MPGALAAAPLSALAQARRGALVPAQPRSLPNTVDGGVSEVRPDGLDEMDARGRRR